MDRIAASTAAVVENPFRERESRIARLEAMEREDRRRFGSRDRERPLRSTSRDPTSTNYDRGAVDQGANHMDLHP